ncbi:MAG: alpha/beta fold hydrolase [Anaerolineales bacterium]|nr:alpha/beta fold hydrolase [Anaerolineales bacterium]
MKTRNLFPLIFLLLLFGLTACTPSATAVEEATPTILPTSLPAFNQEPGAPGTFKPTACRFILPEDVTEGEGVTCGYVTVLENRDQLEGRTLRLAVAIFHRPGGPVYPDPVIYLSGGPGTAALEPMRFSFEAMTKGVFDAGRDLVVFDQRGIGLSRPALDCPEYDSVSLDLFDLEIDGETLDPAQITDRILESLQLCRDRLSQIADLTQYHSASSADDVEDLRQALGYEQVNLWGGSYGTRLGLEVMRRHPEHIRSVILEAVYPPDMDLYPAIPGNFYRSLELLFEHCAANPVCNESYPDLKTILFDTVADLNDSPVTSEITNPFTGETYPAKTDGSVLLSLIFQILYDSKFRYLLPEIIYEASQGEFTLLDRVRGSVIGNMALTSRGMQLTVQCHEEVAFSSPDVFHEALAPFPELAGMYLTSAQGNIIYDICALWDAGQADASANEAVTSDLPVLILNGEFDPITPPAWGWHAAETLSNAYMFDFPGIGHGASVVDPCPRGIFTAFLETPTNEPNVTCIGEMEN